MRLHAGHTLCCFVVAGIVLAGCGDTNTDSGVAKTDGAAQTDGAAKTDGNGQPAADPKAGDGLKIPPLSPELAAKWKDHTLDLPFVVGYEEGMKLAESSNRPAMMYVTTTW